MLRLVTILGQFWAPMTVFFVLSVAVDFILLRTIYVSLRIELQATEAHHEDVVVDYMKHGVCILVIIRFIFIGNFH